MPITLSTQFLELFKNTELCVYPPWSTRRTPTLIQQSIKLIPRASANRSELGARKCQALSRPGVLLLPLNPRPLPTSPTTWQGIWRLSPHRLHPYFQQAGWQGGTGSRLTPYLPLAEYILQGNNIDPWMPLAFVRNLSMNLLFPLCS